MFVFYVLYGCAYCVVCGVGVIVLRWVPAGSLSADAHLHRDLAEGMGEHRQTCTHKQTDEYARAKHGEAFREAHKDEQRCPQPGIRDFVLILISINPII